MNFSKEKSCLLCICKSYREKLLPAIVRKYTPILRTLSLGLQPKITRTPAFHFFIFIFWHSDRRVRVTSNSTLYFLCDNFSLSLVSLLFFFIFFSTYFFSSLIQAESLGDWIFTSFLKHFSAAPWDNVYLCQLFHLLLEPVHLSRLHGPFPPTHSLTYLTWLFVTCLLPHPIW